MNTSEMKRQLGTSTGPETSGLKVGHLNVRSMLPKMTDIGNFMEMYKFDVFAISETWLKDTDRNIDDELKIEGYRYQKIVRADRQLVQKTRGGGVAVYIREGIDYTLIPHPDQIYEDTQNIHMVVKTNCQGQPIPYIHISAFYISPESEKRERLLAILDNHTSCNNVIALGDVNIDLFGPPGKVGPPWGKDIEGVEDRGFCQLINEITHPKRGDPEATHPESGDGLPTTPKRKGRKASLIDHIYVKKSQAKDMISQSGVIQCRISDHDLICCTVGTAFMDRRLGTPEEMLRTIIRGSGHTEAVVKLRELCCEILCRLAANEPVVGIPEAAHANDHLKEITDENHNLILHRYDEWRKLFHEEFGEQFLSHNNQKIFFIRADSKLKFLWLAIGMDQNGKLHTGDGEFVFLDYDKCNQIIKADTKKTLEDHSKEGYGKSAVAVNFRLNLADEDDLLPLWKAYVVYELSHSHWADELLFGEGVVGCKLSKALTGIGHFKDVLSKIITTLRSIPVVNITSWKPFGNRNVLANKVKVESVQKYIKTKYGVDMQS